MIDNRPFELDVRAGGNQNSAVISLKGPMIIEHLFRFQDAWRTEQAQVIIFNLSEVSYMDSSMIGSLVNAHVHYSKNGRKMALAAVPDRVKQFLSVTKVDSLFKFYPTVTEAESTLSGQAVAAQ